MDRTKELSSIFKAIDGSQWLAQSQRAFAANLWHFYKRRKFLSEKQIKILEEIYREHQQREELERLNMFLIEKFPEYEKIVKN